MVLFNVISYIFSLTFIISIFIMSFILPQFTKVYAQLNADLPVFTQILLDTAEWLNNNYIFSILICFCVFIGFPIFWNITERGKSFRDRFFQKISLSNQIIISLYVVSIFPFLFPLFIFYVCYYPIFKFGSAF